MDPITTFLQTVQRQGVPVPAQAEAAIRRGLAGHGAKLSQDLTDQFTQKFLDGLKSIISPQEVMRDEVNVTEGQTPSSLAGDLTGLLRRFEDSQAIAEDLNLDFKMEVATNVMRGGARFVSQNFDQAELDEYPALELLRVYEREVPRGFARVKGTLVTVPDDDWPSRFTDACQSAGDDDALRVLQQTGRMIALKSSGVWAALGNNRDDCLGNPYPPFAFNSGFDVDGVPRKECEELGLIEPNEVAERAPVDFENLFALTD